MFGRRNKRSSKSSSRDERRAFARHPAELPVRFASEALEFEGNLELRGSTADISQTGLCVRCDFLEPEGTEVSLRVGEPGADICVNGKVAWIAELPPEGPAMGIELSNTSFDAALFEWLLAHARVKN
jgi:hypothetical protein